MHARTTLKNPCIYSPSNSQPLKNTWTHDCRILKDVLYTVVGLTGQKKQKAYHFGSKPCSKFFNLVWVLIKFSFGNPESTGIYSTRKKEAFIHQQMCECCRNNINDDQSSRCKNLYTGSPISENRNLNSS